MDFTRNRIVTDEVTLQKSVAVIGVGATGSHLVVELIKLGFTDITIYDTGVVKEHNITNQVYPNGTVGMLKSEALQKIVETRYDADIMIASSAPVDTTFDIVFNCVDERVARQVYRNDMKWNDLFIETAFDVYSSDLFFMDDPELITHIPTADEVTSEVTSACGSRLTVSASVNSFVSSVVWHLIHWLNGELPEASMNKRVTFMHHNPISMSEIRKVEPIEWDN